MKSSKKSLSHLCGIKVGMAALSGSLVMLLGCAAVAASIKPHRAFYEMELGVANQVSNVQSISGRSAFTLARDCDGWVSSEDYVIEFGPQEGKLDRVMTRFESWESEDGVKYSFDIRENSSFDAPQDFNGYATISADGGGAYFSMASDVSVALPRDTYFPVKHLRAIIAHAKSGKKILAASVFTGAKPDDALLATNTVIGGWDEENAGNLIDDFGTDGFWPVRVAYFKPKALSAEPEYEINYSLQPNGIIRGYEIDYGEFTIVAKLLKIEAVVEPVCR